MKRADWSGVVKVTLWTREVGCRFGTEGVVRHGTTVLATTRVFPFRFTGAALEAAETLARDNGWTVVTVAK